MHISRASITTWPHATSHMSYPHTRNFNFAANINQGPRYSHALHSNSYQSSPQPSTNRMSINYGSYPFRQWISPSNLCLQVVTSCTNLKGQEFTKKNIKYHKLNEKIWYSRFWLNKGALFIYHIFTKSLFYLLQCLLRLSDLIQLSSDFTFLCFIPYLSFALSSLLFIFCFYVHLSPIHTPVHHLRYYPFHIPLTILPFLFLYYFLFPRQNYFLLLWTIFIIPYDTPNMYITNCSLLYLVLSLLINVIPR